MKKIFLLPFFFIFVNFSFAQPVLTFTPFVSGFTSPVDMVNAGDGSNRLFVVQQNGVVKIVSGGSTLPTPFLDMTGLVTFSGEQGLLSMAFHPQYATNRYFFVFYNNTAGNTELAQFQTLAGNPNVADATSRKILLTITKPFTNHNGCKLNFGPDGNLYFGTGDGGSGGDPNNNAQNLNSYLGKMLRINVDNFTTAPYYTVPVSNPLVAISNTKPEIYQWGLRNPWRWSFDKQTGDMWIADVGQDAWEELNVIPAASTNGLNFGWRCYEGTHAYDLSLCGATPAAGKTNPVFEYPHTNAGGFSVTGGYVYHGAEYPAMQGYYIMADYVKPNGWIIKQTSPGVFNISTQNNFPANIISFGEAENGTLYLSTQGGTIYKIATTSVVAVSLTDFAVKSINKIDELKWTVNSDASLTGFDIERSDDGIRFFSIAHVAGISGQSRYQYTTPSLKSVRYYRLKMLNAGGSAQYSAVIKLSAIRSDIPVYYEGPRQIKIVNAEKLVKVSLLNVTGQTVRMLGSLAAGQHLIAAGNLSSGIYILRCEKENHETENVLIHF